MGFGQFPQDQYLIIVTDDQPTQAGSLVPGSDIELGHITCRLFKLGAHSGSETLQLHIYGNEDLSTPIASSAEVAVSEIDSLTSSNWIGRVRFDFNREQLDSDNTYYFGIQVNNYTYSEGSYYWAWSLDWPDDVNTPASAVTRGIQASVLGYS